ncbi:MAG: PQQ-dependent sugar dehydrogenase [Candidatus Dojkabacteria bacterium]|jgi:glucose/arabinose dehydrogenase|nr:PQQ-dependent sugar dehydrogenase [Candidatus Dojkabacteria bacterium]
MKRKLLYIFFILIFIFLLGGYIIYRLQDNLDPSRGAPEIIDIFSIDDPDSEVIIATNLEIPWEIAFLDDDVMLITERPGKLLVADPQILPLKIENVEHIGEGGLLGLAIHPDYASNNWIYIYRTIQVNGLIENQVVRYNFTQNKLSNQTVILDGIQGSSVHDGGRIKFGPDSKLYITTGDAGNEDLAQDIDSLNGKILRINDDGSIPDDNPFGTAVWTFGHRNPQGLAWDDTGRLWATEHGRSGILSGFDELNIIEKGKNYGWPVIQGSEVLQGLETPITQSGPDTTWAPAGAVFYNGSIFFTGLRGATLYEYKIEEDELISHLTNEYGRLRALVLHDNFLYVSTSNRDGRGDPDIEDDMIIRIDLEKWGR